MKQSFKMAGAAAIAFLFHAARGFGAEAPSFSNVTAVCFATPPASNGLRIYSAPALSVWQEIPFRHGDASRHCLIIGECHLPLSASVLELGGCKGTATPNQAADCGEIGSDEITRVMPLLQWVSQDRPAGICESPDGALNGTYSSYNLVALPANRQKSEQLCLIILLDPTPNVATTLVVVPSECSDSLNEVVASAIRSQLTSQASSQWIASISPDGKIGIALPVKYDPAPTIEPGLSWGIGIDTNKVNSWLHLVAKSSSKLPEFKSEDDPLSGWSDGASQSPAESSRTIRQALRFIVAACIRLSQPPASSEGTLTQEALRWLIRARLTAEGVGLENSSELLLRAELVRKGPP